ncbi:MAG: winged helix-turn-helix domain-containing protein [Nitrososphaera sp.]
MATRTQFTTRPRAEYDFSPPTRVQSEAPSRLEKEIRVNPINPFEVPSQKTTRRDRVQILLKMLQAAQVPIRKTHLMYGAGINFYQLEKHLSFLMGSGMVEELEYEDTVAYRTTEKGRMFSELFA